jgi:leucine dehydrogenase
MLGEDVRRRDERVGAIADTLAEVFRIADAEGISTEAAADRLAHERIEAAGGGS